MAKRLRGATDQLYLDASAKVRVISTGSGLMGSGTVFTGKEGTGNIYNHVMIRPNTHNQTSKQTGLEQTQSV
jgi:hypothetical protein